MKKIKTTLPDHRSFGRCISTLITALGKTEGMLSICRGTDPMIKHIKLARASLIDAKDAGEKIVYRDFPEASADDRRLSYFNGEVLTQQDFDDLDARHSSNQGCND